MPAAGFIPMLAGVIFPGIAEAMATQWTRRA